MRKTKNNKCICHNCAREFDLKKEGITTGYIARSVWKPVSKAKHAIVKRTPEAVENVPICGTCVQNDRINNYCSRCGWLVGSHISMISDENGGRRCYSTCNCNERIATRQKNLEKLSK